MKRGYPASYFKSRNYTDYLERGPRYARIARDLDGLFKSLSLVNIYDDVLHDFGCGVGFLVEALQGLNYVITGSDASAWARHQARNRGLAINEQPSRACGLIALDVFEHMRDTAIIETLINVNPRFIVARIPCAERGPRFHLTCSRRDTTHINCKTRDEWIKFFHDRDFALTFRLNLLTIYDSPGVACLLAIRA